MFSSEAASEWLVWKYYRCSGAVYVGLLERLKSNSFAQEVSECISRFPNMCASPARGLHLSPAEKKRKEFHQQSSQQLHSSVVKRVIVVKIPPTRLLWMCRRHHIQMSEYLHRISSNRKCFVFMPCLIEYGLEIAFASLRTLRFT